MTLNEWQVKLTGHFSELSRGRNHGIIYALEHGLTACQIADLSEAIRSYIRSSSPSDRHWLPWIVYATEVGYGYSGDEYWSTFADRTPGWIESGADRSWIRSAFFKFHKDYNGARPTGRWADHFSIICWPITHAILPRDLQLQLAQVLYEVRGFFTPELLQSPERLGEQIEAHSWNTTSRFRDLAGEHLLLGQIATALLLTEKDKEASLILFSTLERIAGDLDLNRRSREWLRDARTRAATVRLKGLHRQSSSTFLEEDQIDEEESETRRTIVNLGIEPDLVLRRLDALTWDIRLQLSNLTPLLTQFPQFKDVLTNQRCTVAGGEGRPLARGFLLYGMQEVSLIAWPEPGEVLLKYENSDQQLDFLLATECLLRPGPRWLFKILSDGSAVEIRSKIIQPSSSYIVLTRASSGLAALPFEYIAVNTRCSGVSAVRITVPDTLSEIYAEQIGAIGFQAGSGLRVRPVGTPAAKWDDEGSAEWLSCDPALIAISCDFELSGLALNLVGPSPAKIEIEGDQLTRPILVELGHLDSGRYKLHVIVGRPSSDTPALVHGTLELMIREPRPWKQNLPRSTPFSVFASPPKPQLEEVWDGRATLDIRGPQGRKAECDVRFFRDIHTQQILYSKRLTPIDLPCSNESWQRALDAARHDKRAQNAYDESSFCIFELQCEELGEVELACEREPTPLRWILKLENSGYSLRLAQLDEQQSVSVSRYAFESPDRVAAVPGDGGAAFQVSDDGGLYSAAINECHAEIIVPPRINAFSALGLRVRLCPWQPSEQHISDLLTVIELWSKARVAGDPICRMRKEQVLRCLMDRLVALLCGDIWASLEKGRTGSSNIVDLRNAISSGFPGSEVGRALDEKHGELVHACTTDTCRRLNALASSYLDLPVFSVTRNHGVARQEWVTEFAFRLTNEPERVRLWAGLDFSEGLSYVLRNRVLLRMTRFVALLRARVVGCVPLPQNVEHDKE